jgi:hypothetical protein
LGTRKNPARRARAGARPIAPRAAVAAFAPRVFIDRSKQAEHDRRNEREYKEDPNDVKVHVQWKRITDL